ASGEELTNMMIKIGRLSFIVLLYILGAFFLYGKQFVFLWVGESYHDAWIIALLIMIAYTIPLVQGFGNSILEAKNKLAFKAIIYLFFMIAGTVLGAFLAKKYNAIGMITGSLIGWFLVQNIMNFYYHKVIKLNILRFFKELTNKVLATVIFTVILGYFVNFIPGEGWFNFVLKAIIYTLIFIPLMFSFGMHEYERKLFKEPVLKLINKKV